MIELYVCLIRNRIKNLSQVPVKFQDVVKKDLTVLGVDENGNVIAAA